jgi:hypothetical protein
MIERKALRYISLLSYCLATLPNGHDMGCIV